ncbi:hypothetical protein F1559_002649 [Cyanidiococcus yangmingshanensis]|uniref:Uncharacterized protein n=1 Tax=Cyanidiococcus yangmingshanensis TaxID=2690220 RepID=A0A7J7IEL0_9RHOD|nr:hypothetical protein F1559_002649 [Cyanidiococcus yangmingshanensis]
MQADIPDETLKPYRSPRPGFRTQPGCRDLLERLYFQVPCSSSSSQGCSGYKFQAKVAPMKPYARVRYRLPRRIESFETANAAPLIWCASGASQLESGTLSSALSLSFIGLIRLIASCTIRKRSRLAISGTSLTSC